MAGKRSRLQFRMPPLSWFRAIWKQKILLAAVWLVGSAVGITIVYLLPPTYKATAVILVESQRIPQTFVAPTVGEDLKERLANLKQQILSYTRLLEVVNKFGLYAAERKTHVEEEIVDRMRSDVDVELEKSWAADRPGAFRISYRGPSPTVTALVVNELANRFIDENLRAREVQAGGTSEFLDSQMGEAKQRLQEQEAKLGQYKVTHNGQLPEQQQALLTRVNQLQLQLQGVQDAISRVEQNRIMVDTSLKLAQDSFATIIEMAQRAGSEEGDPMRPFEAGKPKPSKQLEEQLRILRTHYTNNHPDVIRTEKLLEVAREAEAEEQEKNDAPPQASEAESGAAANKRKTRSLLFSQSLEREHERVEQLKSQQLVLAKQIADYERERQQVMHEISTTQARVDQLPLREQEMASVTRDYQISKANYQSLLDKKLAADMAADMERRQKAERFTMLDRGRVPEKPFQPNRPLLAGAACIAALVLAVGLCVAREMHASVFLGEWELPMGAVVLARIPVIRRS